MIAVLLPSHNVEETSKEYDKFCHVKSCTEINLEKTLFQWVYFHVALWSGHCAGTDK